METERTTLYRMPWQQNLSPERAEEIRRRLKPIDFSSDKNLTSEALQANAATIFEQYTQANIEQTAGLTILNAEAQTSVLLSELAVYYYDPNHYIERLGAHQSKTAAIITTAVGSSTCRVGDLRANIVDSAWRSGTTDPSRPSTSHIWTTVQKAGCLRPGPTRLDDNRRIPLNEREINASGDIREISIPACMSLEAAAAFYTGTHELEDKTIACADCTVHHLCRLRKHNIPAIAQSIENYYKLQNLKSAIRLVNPESEQLPSIFEILYQTSLENGLNPSRGQTEALIQLAIVLDNKSKTDGKQPGYKLGLYEAIGGAGKSELFRSIEPAFKEISEITGLGFQLEIDGTPGMYHTSTNIASNNQVLISLGREAATNGELDIKIPVKGFTHDEVTNLLGERHQGVMVPAYVKAARENCLGSMALADTIYKSLLESSPDFEDTRTINKNAYQEAALFLTDRLLPILGLTDQDYQYSSLIGAKALNFIHDLVMKYWYHELSWDSGFNIADNIETIANQNPIDSICRDFGQYEELEVNSQDMAAIVSRYKEASSFRGKSEPRLSLIIEFTDTTQMNTMLLEFERLAERLVKQKRKVRFMAFDQTGKLVREFMDTGNFDKASTLKETYTKGSQQTAKPILLLVTGDHTSLPRASSIRAAVLTEMYFRSMGIVPEYKVTVF